MTRGVNDPALTRRDGVSWSSSIDLRGASLDVTR